MEHFNCKDVNQEDLEAGGRRQEAKNHKELSLIYLCLVDEYVRGQGEPSRCAQVFVARRTRRETSVPWEK